MSRNAKSRRYKERHGIAHNMKTRPCRKCFGHIERMVKDMPQPRFESKALRHLRDMQS